MERRQLLQLVAASCALGAIPGRALADSIHTRPIPATGERIPVLGLGTWLTFSVGGAI